MPAFDRLRLASLMACCVLPACGGGDPPAGDPDAMISDSSTAPADASDSSAPDDTAVVDSGPEAAPTHDAGCSFGGWCWVQPDPQGNRLNAGYSLGADDAWFVGEAGSVVHWDGKSARAVASAGKTSDAYRDVWAAAPNDVWVVGAGKEGALVHHFDGVAWTAIETTYSNPGYASVWGAAKDDVWLGGYSGFLSHWDGSTLTDHDPIAGAEASSWRTMWGSSAKDVWAGGESLAHFDGTSWSVKSKPGSRVLRIDGTAADDVWLVEYDGVVRHFDGSTWKEMATIVEVQDLRVVAKDNVWITLRDGLFHWEGGNFVRKTYRGAERSYGYMVLANDRPSGLWEITGAGRVERWQDKDLGAIAAADDDFDSAISGLTKDDAWIATFRGARHWNGTSWTRFDVFKDDYSSSIFAAGPSDVVLIGQYGNIARWNGATWSVSAPTAMRRWYASAGIGPSDIWIGGEGVLSHWDGSTWSETAVEGGILAMTAVATNDIWAVIVTPATSESSFLHYDGTAWSKRGAVPDGASIRRMWAAAKDDVWATSNKGVYHLSAGTWTNVLPAAHGARGVFGTSPTDVWLVQERGIITHWNGSDWSLEDSGTTTDLFDVWANASDVWATGGGNAILRHSR
jgi:hypothetical protein